MSPARAEELELPHPRETHAFYGHAEAEQKLLADYRSGRIAHAWLIGRPRAGGEGQSRGHQRAVQPDSPGARRVAGQAHPDLLVLERTPGDNGQLRTVITVEQVRRTVGFFGSTPREGGGRGCGVDSADELKYPEGSNAVLKVLEEPPARSLFLAVSHAPGRLLPTIRSRCRRLSLRPLDEADVAQAAASALGDTDEATLRQAAGAADGSGARAIALYGGPQAAPRGQGIHLL